MNNLSTFLTLACGIIASTQPIYSDEQVSTVEATVSPAQDCSLKGMIVDKDTQEPLLGATIQVAGTSKGSVADFDGLFELSGLSAGSYLIEVNYLGYKSYRTEVDLGAQAPTLKIELASDLQVLKGVEVVARRNDESEYAQMIAQQQATLAVQGVGAKELSRKGIGDAQGAVTQISGIAKQEGVKNVFVRGLGDRYNSTTFNGFEIPSDDPEYKNIALDLFSSDVIQSVGVMKAFAAQGSGDVAGAQIDIVSKELVGDSHFGLNGSLGTNTNLYKHDFRQAQGANYWGISSASKPGISGYGFESPLDPELVAVPLPHSYGFSAGKQWALGEQASPLSVYVVASQSKDYDQHAELVRNTTTTGDIYQDQQGSKDEVNTQQMVLGNVNFAFKDILQLDYHTLLIHANQSYFAQYSGLNDKYQSSDTFTGMTQRQQTNDNTLWVNQLMGSYQMPANLKLDAGVSYSTLNGSEPDRRINNLVDMGGSYNLMKGTGAQQRFFSDLNQDELSLRTALSYSLKDDKVSGITLGYKGRMIDHKFEASEYDLSPIKNVEYQLENLSLDNYYNQENFEQGWFEMDLNEDHYRVNKKVNSIYAQLNYKFGAWTTMLGLAVDDVRMSVDYDVNRGATQGETEFDKTFFLPSLNLRHDWGDKHALRLSLSKTYTLPQAKEISPYRYVGINFQSQGNPDLQPSDNYNADLKWDWYLGKGELLSLGVFYKHIVNPIARIEVASAGGYLTYANIAPQAQVSGVEMEVRKQLLHQSNCELQLGGNISYLYSHAKVEKATDPTGSTLEGASPFLANVDLTYIQRSGKHVFTQTLLCDYFSDRVYTIGTQGYEDIIEKGIPSLNFVSKAQLNQKLSLTLKCQNLLNQAHTLTRKGSTGAEAVTLSDYRQGRSFSLSVAYDF